MGFFRSLFKSPNCAMFKRKMPHLTGYVDDKGNKIKVCIQCREYAERRAFRKL